MKIGKIKLASRVFLSPMAGYTNLPFRLLCKEYGAGLVCTELVSVKAVVHGSEKTKELLRTHKSEGPVGVQLFGSDPRDFGEATKRVEGDFDFVDVNAGCSVPRILAQDAGAGLLKNPEKLAKIIREVRGATDKPVTLKVRAGIDERHVNVEQVVKAAHEAGCAAIAVHARTIKQLFSGEANWEWIKKAKRAAGDMPVIGNGDVKTPEDAKRMLAQTGCDFVGIGRAAMGEAALFSQCTQHLDKWEYAEKGSEVHAAEFERYVQLCQKHGCSDVDFKRMALAYVRESPHARFARKKICEYAKAEDVARVVRDFWRTGSGNHGQSA